MSFYNGLQTELYILVIPPQFLIKSVQGIMQNTNEIKVIRSFSLPLVTFEYLKKFQREYLETHRASINNSQAIAVLLSEHELLVTRSK